MRIIWSALIVALLMVACGAATAPVVPAPSPLPTPVPAPEPVPVPTPPPAPALPNVTLTLEPSVATVVADSNTIILCIVAPPEPYLGMPPGAVSRICQPIKGWQALQVVK